MWSTDVFSRAWLLLWRVALSPSRRVEGSSPQSASLKLRPSPRDMESIWRRSRTPMGRSSANPSIRRNRREDGCGLAEDPRARLLFDRLEPSPMEGTGQPGGGIASECAHSGLCAAHAPGPFLTGGHHDSRTRAENCNGAPGTGICGGHLSIGD